MDLTFDFEPFNTPPEAEALRAQVREFLQHSQPARSALHRAHSWTGFDAQFSRALGARGWIGMTWPKEYGGHACTPIERYVVLEELLAAGAPVGAHWIADRQSGPLLLRYGTEAQKQAHLPCIARGEMFFCIGMSEPNAGSDLAAIRSAARKTDRGWCISGQKVWTTNAQRAHRMIALVRTSQADNRHAGLSQFLLDLGHPAIRVRPITDLVGEQHFNEVFLDDVEVGADSLIGVEGQGWQQVTAELSLERSGPERYLSSLELLLQLVRTVGTAGSGAFLELVGEAVAQLWTLRQMSLSVAGKLSRGEDPGLQAAIFKDLGNGFEQRLPQLAQAAVAAEVDLINPTPLNEVLGFLLQTSPSFSLRGGTREILRGIVARGLGLR